MVSVLPKVHVLTIYNRDLQRQQEQKGVKELVVLDPKRSNVINIGMTKLPPPRTIKTAILKMDSSIINREGIEVCRYVYKHCLKYIFHSKLKLSLHVWQWVLFISEAIPCIESNILYFFVNFIVSIYHIFCRNFFLRCFQAPRRSKRYRRSPSLTLRCPWDLLNSSWWCCRPSQSSLPGSSCGSSNSITRSWRKWVLFFSY